MRKYVNLWVRVDVAPQEGSSEEEQCKQSLKFAPVCRMKTYKTLCIGFVYLSTTVVEFAFDSSKLIPAGSSFLAQATASFCSCQPDSRVATVVGDEEWAIGYHTNLLNICAKIKLGYPLVHELVAHPVGK